MTKNHQQNKTWGTALKPINVLISTGAITKLVPSPRVSTNLWGWWNPYVWFVHGPLTVFNPAQVKVSGSTNADPINMINTSQKSTKKAWMDILKESLENPKNNAWWIENNNKLEKLVSV